MKKFVSFFKRIPLWLLSFLIINILYLIFKDVVYYLAFFIVIGSIILIKIKRNRKFVVFEIIVFVLYAILFVISISDKEASALKMILINLETWFFVYLFL